MTSNKRDAILETIVALGRTLPAEVADGVARALDADDAVGALAAVQQGDTHDRLKRLLVDWRRLDLAASSAALAWALRAAVATDAWHRANETLELVWTGPAPAGSSLRRTDQALLELIRSAQRSIVIVMFAAHKVPAIRDALLEALRRGVSVTFILESVVASEGRVSFDPIIAMGRDLAELAEILTWPLDRRARDDRGRHGTLHAKCALVDDIRLLVSSANFTGDAMTLNMELGVLIEGGDLPQEVGRHLDALAATGVITPVRR